MKSTSAPTRRRFLREVAGAVGAGAAAAITLADRERPAHARDKPRKPHAEEEEAVSPTEDLMREHGVLRRILLVYGGVIRRADANLELAPVAEPIAHAATIVRAFIEDYHERDEEEHIFPRLVKAGQLTDLVAILVQQHRAGRNLTAAIQRLATAPSLRSPANRRALAEAMRAFIRMYEPHAAREDTVLFPAFARIVGERELHALMELFEQKEHALPLGDFEKMVSDVAAIERALGLYDLAQFTPV